MNVSTKSLNEAHATALSLKEQIEALKLQYHAATDVLAQAGSGKHYTEHGSFLVSENNVYDDEVITEALTKGQFMKCSQRKIVKALVKVHFPAVYEAAKERRGWKVSV